MDWREAKISAGVGPGWEPLVDELHAKVLEIDPDVVVEQVKEKFGGLRYYYYEGGPINIDIIGADRVLVGKSDLALENLVTEYEALSFTRCEWCGAPGETSAPEMRWLKTLCPEHTKAWKQGKRWWS